MVGLLAPTGADLLVCLLGIMRAGAAVTVLPAPLGTNKLGAHAERLCRTLEVAGVERLVGADAYAPLLAELTSRHGALDIVAPSAAGTLDSLPELDSNDPAVVQFTSGSTGSPRGVTLTHGNVVAGLSAIIEGAALVPDDVLIQWVPLYHDMGLFGLLANMLNGAESHVFAPFDFLRGPGDVLRYLAERHGTLMTGPNFAYELLAGAAEPVLKSGLDLSRWRLAFNGAEPVSAATVRRFLDVLGPAGVRPSTMFPVYGMAEVTLAISFPEPGSVPRTVRIDGDSLRTGDRVRLVAERDSAARELVSVGRPVPGIDVRVTGVGGTPCAEEELGEIQVRGAAVTSGYLHDGKATRAAFDGPWLRTGDLGFRHRGDLYIAGRRKEMAIVHGRNIFPEDVEAVARDVPGVYRGRCVAAPISARDGTELVALVVETELSAPEHPGLVDAVRRRVAAAMDLHAVRIHIVNPHWLTRTSSGKWQRLQAVRAAAAEATNVPRSRSGRQ